MAKQIKYLDYEGLKALYGVVDGKIKVESDRAKAEEKALDDAIKAMDLVDTPESGKFITAVHQTDGKVTVDRGGVSASMVTATNVEAGAGTVAITGATVEDQIKNLGQTLKTVEGNAAKYALEKVSQEEVDRIDPSIREAYRLVSYVGDYVEGTQYPTAGPYIKIYKDATLKNAELGKGEDAQKLILTYILHDGSEKEVKIDFAAIAFNTEFKDGLQVATNGEISVQVDTASEGFLTVGEGGVKLAGVQSAIDAAVAAKNVTAQGDDYITATAAGNKVSVRADVQPLTVVKIPGTNSTITGVAQSLVDGAEVAAQVAAFTNDRISEEIAKLFSEKTSTGGAKVAVKVTEVNGKIDAVNVTETDIASKKALDTEVTRAKAAEDKIEASVGLADDGSFTAPAGKNYINGATTVMGAVEKLDVQVKANADKIAGMSVDEDNQTVTIDSKGLQFVAFTAEEIQNAAKPEAGQ